ncbi:molybdopterin-dependent oxidoreductase [Kribbella jejuensis]|uniref:Molybdopterin-dependent oxidoreductase iron-sulfur protein n=1 Tax=Kribbella jejuensis TaxID=236068 RepID=A0A542EAB8_9ACTN|nr:molybdopterin-dependent oxidoreductase [Kribbella jejuensis]TQJ12278.1 molybdopterin-dependent oxidoreductase iron-sulfur protein [Kribbella jejuensis]
MGSSTGVRRIPTYCPLCVSKCGAIATVDDGRFVSLAPDPSHPTGQALCIKGKAAPELVNHPDRLLYPLRRTAPKGAADPGWQRIGWDEALDTIAARLTGVARDHGPQSVVFATASPSTSAMSDSIDWLNRLRQAFGSPNLAVYMELCAWGRIGAPVFTFGAAVPGTYMPDLANAGCILYWGYNPSVARLAHATATTAALRRGAKLVVVDPRRAGLASKADHWLRVLPGTDAALALAMIHVMLERGWYDDDFVRRWTNAPLLVRTDTGQLLRAAEDPNLYIAWDEGLGRPVTYEPSTGRYDADASHLALTGSYELPTPNGPVPCRPVFALLAEECARTTPQVAEQLTSVPAASIEAAARTLWESRPVAFYTWSGLEQHSNVTQTVRAIHILYALTGCLDVRGGNVAFTPVPANQPAPMAALGSARALGFTERPLGPAGFGYVTGSDLYAAALDGQVRALVTFGANLVMAHGDSARGRAALSAIDFVVHADLFLNPTADLADIVLPVASGFESEALRIGFETDQAAQSLVQLRTPVAPARGEARSDLQIMFALAARLGLGEQFFDGDVEEAFRYQLEPSGIKLEQLREDPAGVRVPLSTRYRKYRSGGFRTPTGKVELYSETLLAAGHPPLPAYLAPSAGAGAFPLTLTSAKSLWFCESQHRGIPGLRRSAPDPQVEIHPDTAGRRGIAAGDWVRISTPSGSVRARAKFNANLDPSVVCGQHGWWQPCPDLDLPGYPAAGPDSANLNLILPQQPADPISGSSPLRASPCEITPLSSAVTH